MIGTNSAIGMEKPGDFSGIMAGIKGGLSRNERKTLRGIKYFYEIQDIIFLNTQDGYCG